MRKPIIILLLILTTLLAALPACQTAAPATEEAVFTVTDGPDEATYTAADLQAMPTAEATMDGTTYVGVTLATLLENAGVDPATVSEVTAAAADDFSATYTAEQVTRPDTLVAFATQDGELAEGEQPFRMVLPDEAGQLNVRMLSRIEVSP